MLRSNEKQNFNLEQPYMTRNLACRLKNKTQSSIPLSQPKIGQPHAQKTVALAVRSKEHTPV